jgi:CRP/FNR family transcriptional regulator, anaerobic regulatory protein
MLCITGVERVLETNTDQACKATTTAGTGWHRGVTVPCVRDVTAQGDWVGGMVRRVATKAHLFTEGDPKSHVYRVTSGAICLYRVLTDGRRQVIEFALEGDVIGMGYAPIESCSAQAMGPTRVSCFPVAILLKAAAQDCSIALGLYEALSRDLAAAQKHLLCVGKRSATERLASFLVNLSRRSEERGGDPVLIKLAMTRVDIADFLGLTIETVSRTFTKLKQQRLIGIDQNTTIRLRDRIALARLAEGEERI